MGRGQARDHDHEGPTQRPAALAMMHKRGLIHMLVVNDRNRPLRVLNARDGLRALLAAGNHEEGTATQLRNGRRLPMKARC